VAAAATAAVVSVKGMPATSPPCAVVDRPFLFALIHKASGAPLFVGRVLNPLQN
jgi:serine protease inhibitor